jgi:hypothetical protein
MLNNENEVVKPCSFKSLCDYKQKHSEDEFRIDGSNTFGADTTGCLTRNIVSEINYAAPQRPIIISIINPVVSR